MAAMATMVLALLAWGDCPLVVTVATAVICMLFSQRGNYLSFTFLLQRNVKTVKQQKKEANLPLRRYAVKA